MELLAAIESRSSAARLVEPGPSAEQLSRMLGAAARAPDHGRLKPWHLLVLDQPTKERLASAAAQAKRALSSSFSDQQFAAERDRIMRSPTIVIVGCVVREHPKVPQIEQVIATAAAAQNLFLAAHDLGCGVMWKTGAAAYDANVKALVGLRPQDHIVAIMHLGTRPT